MIESKALIIGLMAVSLVSPLIPKLISNEARKHADEAMADALKIRPVSGLQRGKR